MTFALVAHVQTAGGVNGGVSSAIDTTGANLIVVNVSFRAAGTGGPVTVTDSKGNTYTVAVSSGTPGAVVTISQQWYCLAPTVGAGHTFTITGTNVFAIADITAWSGAATSLVLDVTNSNVVTSGTTIQAGSVTPSQANSLVIAGLSSQAPGAVTISGGFTISDQNPIAGGVSYSVAMAYLVQTTATAANPTWSGCASDTGATIAAFKPAPSIPMDMTAAAIMMNA